MEGYAVRKPRRQKDARYFHVRRVLLIVSSDLARPRGEQAPKTPPRDPHRHGQAILVWDDGDAAEGRQLIKILAVQQWVPGDLWRRGRQK
jgi:hypothetical protein